MEAAMRRMRFVIFTALLGFCSTVDVARADDAANAWKALRAGGHVALMRHADAPGGVGDPPGSASRTVPPSATSAPREGRTQKKSDRGSRGKELRSKKS